MSQDEFLIDAASSLGLALDLGQAAMCRNFLAELYRWNRRAGLTNIRAEDGPRLHLLDSLAVVPLIEGVVSLADLGSGAGLPGIPLSIALPALRVTLVESRPIRCSFLREVKRKLGLDNVDVLEQDAARLEARGLHFDGVVSRAFRSPGRLLPMARGLLESGGRLVVMAGGGGGAGEEAAECAGLSFETERVLRLPGGGERRRLQLFRRL